MGSFIMFLFQNLNRRAWHTGQVALWAGIFTLQEGGGGTLASQHKNLKIPGTAQLV